jgi:hypothetical protein
MDTQEHATAKLLFVRDGRLWVQNFSHLRFYRADGTVFRVENFEGWVELITGDEEARTLEVLLTGRDEARLVRKRPSSSSWKQLATRRDLIMVGIGFAIFILLDHLLS